MSESDKKSTMCSFEEIADSFLFKSDDYDESPKSCFSNYYINHFE